MAVEDIWKKTLKYLTRRQWLLLHLWVGRIH